MKCFTYRLSVIYLFMLIIIFFVNAPTAYSGTNSDQSVKELEEKLSNYLKSGVKDEKLYAQLLNDLGLAYWKNGFYTQAKDTLRKAIDIKIEKYGEKHDEYLVSLSNYAGLLVDIGSFEKAKRYYFDVLRINKSQHGTESIEFANSLNNLGELFIELGIYDRALAFYQKSLEVSKAIIENHPELFAKSLASISKSYLKTGKLDKALGFVQRSLNEYEKMELTKSIDYLETLEILGNIYERMGRFGEAEKVLLKTLNLKYSMPDIDQVYVVETLNDLGVLYKDLANYEKAQEYLIKAKDASAVSVGDRHHDYAIIINHLASVYKTTKEFEKAKSLYEESSEIFLNEYGEYHPSYATVLNNLAGVHRQLGNYKEAKALYEKTIKIDKIALGMDHPDYAMTVNNLAILYSSMGDYEHAEPLYQKSLELRKHSLGENHPSYAKSLDNLGLYYLSHNQEAKSKSYFNQAIQIQINQVNTVFPALSELEREQFYTTVRQDVERFSSVAYQLKDDSPDIIGDLYNSQLATKAIIFYASEKMRNGIYNSGDQELIDDFIRWKSLKSRLAKYYQIGESRLKQMNINLEDLEDFINNLEKKLSYKSREFSESLQDNQVDWKDIRSKLNDDEAAIEIVRFRDFKNIDSEDEYIYGFSDKVMYAALIVKKDSYLNPEFVIFEDGNVMEKQYYAAFKNALKYNVRDIYSYNVFWKKIADKLEGINKVYLSPDGIYNKLNPNAFYHNETKKFLINASDIVLLTSTKDLFDNKSQEIQNNEVVLVGNPDYNENQSISMPDALASSKEIRNFSGFPFKSLPGTEIEVQSISNRFEESGWDYQKYLYDDATEESIKNVNHPRILHIASHGYFLGDEGFAFNVANVTKHNPLFKSGLILSNANQSIKNFIDGKEVDTNREDGILTAYEAMNLNLGGTDLVVLSACETGLGEIRNGEGVYGLQRAFKVAGADNLIISLFKVQDQETQVLMTAFYDNYLKTGNIRESFRNAQITLQEKYNDPLVWGAFILIGEG